MGKDFVSYIRSYGNDTRCTTPVDVSRGIFIYFDKYTNTLPVFIFIVLECISLTKAIK